LNAAVKRLRAALGDNAEQPRFVETLPRRGYRFIAPIERIETEESGTNGAAPVSEPPDRKRRLAVLPFSNVGGNGSHEYFAAGLTEEMITQLGRLFANRLGVVARHSSTLVHDTAKSAREIGRALRADYLVQGSVRQEGDRVRIAAQLVETRGETQLWAESYDRHLADCFVVQAEVATRIVHSLAMELLPDARALRGASTRDVGAHQAYLKGRYHWNRSGADGMLQALTYYEQALLLDPTFATAYAALGRAHLATADYYLCDPQSALESARVAATRALELDPSDSEAHLTLAEVRRIVDWDWDGAEEAFRLAVAFNPSNEAAHRHYGLFLAARGRRSEAARAAKWACDLDPLCLVVNTSAAWVRYLALEFGAAIDACRHTLDMSAEFVPARRVLAAALLQAGRLDEAISELESVPDAKQDPVLLAWLAHAAATSGDIDRATKVLAQLTESRQYRYVSAYHLALAHTATGDVDAAFSLLHRACDAHDPAIINLGAEPRLAPLRGDIRYGALVERLGWAAGHDRQGQDQPRHLRV
jgi:TolB-like protein/Tfp pilus assembly protein PilF